MSVEARGRDDVIFGGSAKTKQKDPQPTPEIQRAIDDVTSLGTSATSNDFKNVGNLCFGHKMFSAAIKFYSSALERDPDNEVLLSNRSAAYVQSILLSGPSLALKDAKRAIELKPSWFKAHLRAGDAYFAQKKVAEALAEYKTALDLNRDCQTAAQSILACERLLAEECSDGVSGETAAGPKSPERAPYIEERHGQVPQPPRTTAAAPPVEQRLDTETLIKTWSRDTETTEAVPFRKFNASVAEADREAGQAAKSAWLSGFRKKVETDPDLKGKLDEKLEKEKLAGDGHNYRKEPPRVFAKGTDAVGLAISADAYKTHKGVPNAFW